MQRTRYRNNNSRIQQQLPIQKQHGEKTKPNILTNCFQTIKRKTRNTNTKTRHNTNNTRIILHKQKQFPRQRHTTYI